MSPFDVSEAAVRQSVSRMSRQGWLVARRDGNRAYYAVTERGRRRIEELSPRVYGPVIEWDGRWRMLTYNVSEAQREQRDRLRKELAVLGWAPLSSSTWISPADGLGAARDAAEAMGHSGPSTSLPQVMPARSPIGSCSRNAGTLRRLLRRMPSSSRTTNRVWLASGQPGR